VRDSTVIGFRRFNQVVSLSGRIGDDDLTEISRVRAREVLDSRGDPTVHVEVSCADGCAGSAIVPAGASTGKAEAFELRDGDPARYEGRGVLQAVANVVGRIAPVVVGMDPADQCSLDARLLELDGTPNKSELGGNAILGVSLAAAHAGAAAKKVPLYRHVHELWQAMHRGQGESVCGACKLPLPMTNMISGGLHAGGNLDFQDFLILPAAAPDFATGLEWIVRSARRLGRLLGEAGFEGRLVGDEGGYGPRLTSNAQAAELIVQSVEAAGLRPGRDMSMAIDVASSQFFDGVHYRLKATGERCLTSSQMLDELETMVDTFPIVSIEDGLAEEDWEGWQVLTRRLGRRVRLVGDDLFATNSTRLQRGIDAGIANSVLIKLNQIGTLSETLQTMHLARRAGYTCVVSARSGESEDTTIADLAVGTSAEMIKVGSIQRSERLAKYNRLLAIEQELQRGDS
jgi:enolase